MNGKKIKYICCMLISGMVFINGCGIVGILGIARNDEIKVAPEIDLTDKLDKKILVLVDQPAWLDSQENISISLTEAMNDSFVEKMEFPAENLISYSELAKLRSRTEGFSSIAPETVGRALSADYVLLVVIEDYQLMQLAETEYYKAYLSSKVMLYDVKEQKKVWPETEGGKFVAVGFESERAGRKAAISRLTSTSAYCTTRYFYHCTKRKFKTADDRSGPGWKDWKD